MDNSTITLGAFLQKLDGGKRFVIPDYQRGYVWGQTNPRYITDSVTNLIKTLIPLAEEEKTIFLQGITVVEDGNDIIIVDGQQRTTFFYLLLRFLSDKVPFNLYYSIREESNNYLNNKMSISDEADIEEEYQDIYFFKKTLGIFREELKNISNKEAFGKRIMDNVNFLYIPIKKEQANIVFSMMNGNKAEMTKEELIKAELLRCSSISNVIKESENTNIRSRLAREWDKWMYWWKNKDVRDFYGIETILGWILPMGIGKVDYTFDSFKDRIGGQAKQSKEFFKKLRFIQKDFEDWYNNPRVFNYMGIVLKTVRKDIDSKFQFLNWFSEVYKIYNHDVAFHKLKQYCYCALLNMTHKEITEHNKEQFESRYNDFFRKLESNSLYKDFYDVAYKWLLLCNVEEDNKQNGKEGRKFDFSIDSQKSLEHIYPKSKVGHKDENGNVLNWNNDPMEEKDVKLWREQIICDEGNNKIYASEHSIGNLVLLYGNENSKFNAKEVEEKKEIFFKNEFDEDDEKHKIDFYKSRHLIHTISVFANSQWIGEDIAKNKINMLDQFGNYYNNVFDE